MHTNSSDGFLSPAELLEKLQKSGITTVSITDHDSVAALDALNRRAHMYHVRSIPGVELSAEFEGKDLHFLGYFIMHHNKRFLDYLYLFQRRRYQRAQEMTEKFEKLGIHISMEKVAATARNRPIGRPHIADALVEAGYARSRNDAFLKFLHDDGPVYVEKYRITAAEVIELIHSIGGAAFLAHPGISCDDQTIRKLISAGLDGIEVIHPRHTPDMARHFKTLARELSILECGGSDYHGDPGEDEELGVYTIREADVNRIEQYCLTKRDEWGILEEEYEADEEAKDNSQSAGHNKE